MALVGPVASFASAPIYLWDNQEGFIAGRSCEIKPSDRNPFRVSQYYSSRGGMKDTENLRNYSGVHQSHLVNFSLVKITDKKRKHNASPIEVIGVNKRTDARVNRWSSERGDRGYLHNNSLRPSEDFVFEVGLNKDQLKTLNEEGVSLDHEKETFLRVASGASYFRAVCDNTEEREYILFRVYQKDQNEKAIFYAGVSAEETALFSSLRTFGKVESMSFLKEVGNEAPLVAVEPDSLVVTSPPSVEQDLVSLSESNQSLEDLAEAAAMLEDEGEAKNEEMDEVQVDSDAEESKEESDDSSDLAPVYSVVPKPRPANLGQVSLQNIVCTGGDQLNVRDETLDKVLFKAKVGEKITLFQSFNGENTVERVVNGKKHVFKKVEFKERESSDQRIGYIASSFIKTEGTCPILKEVPSLRLNPPKDISGLDDSECCDFPTAAKPTHSYTSGMRRFSAGRSGGRLHAACDLYRYRNEPIRAVAPGKVIRNLYYFYQGTYALEVRHSGGFVVRYGEMTNKRYVSKNAQVRMGQRIGNMGVVNSGCCRPMLHFELYKGNKTGSLSTGRGRHRRRSDLMDPTPYLLKWQDKVF